MRLLYELHEKHDPLNAEHKTGIKQEANKHKFTIKMKVNHSHCEDLPSLDILQNIQGSDMGALLQIVSSCFMHCGIMNVLYFAVVFIS